jgi:hypothetical protein
LVPGLSSSGLSELTTKGKNLIDLIPFGLADQKRARSRRTRRGCRVNTLHLTIPCTSLYSTPHYAPYLTILHTSLYSAPHYTLHLAILYTGPARVFFSSFFFWPADQSARTQFFFLAGQFAETEIFFSGGRGKKEPPPPQ